MIVTTQEELDAAFAAGETNIIIDAPEEKWVSVGGENYVEVRGHTRVIARDLAYVIAGDSSRVVAQDSASVRAKDRSNVIAQDSVSVEAFHYSSVEAGGSVRVVAWDSVSVSAWSVAFVEARGSSSVSVRGSSSVVARGSASVMAWGSSKVTAMNSVHVVARDSASVVALDSVHVKASNFVVVQLRSVQATVSGGVVVDLTKLDPLNLADWAEYHGAEIVVEGMIVYKAVDANLRSGLGFAYPIGETLDCPDWNPLPVCGGGLHFSPHPAQARDYYPDATRFLKCLVPVDDLVIIDGADNMTPKLKARTARVLCEVDVYGQEINK